MEGSYIHFFGTTGDKKLIFSNKRSAGGVYICIEVKPQTEYIVNNIKIKTSIPHRHNGTENYGYTFSSEKHSITFMTDTVYFDGLAEAYPKSDVLVINVPYDSVPKGKKMKHLSLDALPHIIRCIKPQKVFLTHFGESMDNAGPEECARVLAQETSCDVIAVEENQKYGLS